VPKRKGAKLKTYLVWYTNRHKAKVRAFTADGARRQAWRLIAGGFTYGWTRSDFLKNATVEVVS